MLVSPHAYERDGYNAIPAAVSATDQRACRDIQFDTRVVQTNIVGHTGADGFARLARQAVFDGEVRAGPVSTLWWTTLLAKGGTLANLRGWVEDRREVRSIYAVGPHRKALFRQAEGTR